MEQKFIIYQLLLRVFGNKNANCVSNGSLLLNGSGKFSSISNNVFEYLHSLNVTHIWYTGVIEHVTKTDFTKYGIKKDNPSIIKGEAGSPYAIKDYYDVNPYLADDVNNRMAEADQLIERTHNNGFKVIIDFVPNHLAREYFSDSLPANAENFGESDNTNFPFSPQNNFYYLPDKTFIKGTYTEKPAKATGNDCFTDNPTDNDWYETVKLNYGVDYLSGKKKCFNPIPKTWLMMKDVLMFWLGKGVDGFRCDMAEMVPAEFWKWCIGEVKEKFPATLFIAEVYNPNEYDSYIGAGFDFLYDKVGLYDTLKAISQGNLSAEAITSNWQFLGDRQYKMLNFLENHDEQRIASAFNLRNPFKAIPELVVSLMFNRTPFMLYFGQEVGEEGMLKEGFSGEDGRTSIFDYCAASSVVRLLNDNLKTNEEELLKIYRELLSVAMHSFSIKYGDTYDLQYANSSNEFFDKNKCFVFARKTRYMIDNSLNKGELSLKTKELSIIVVDFSQSYKSTKINLPDHFYKFWDIDNKKIPNSLNITFNEFGYSILKFQDF